MIKMSSHRKPLKPGSSSSNWRHTRVLFQVTNRMKNRVKPKKNLLHQKRKQMARYDHKALDACPWRLLNLHLQTLTYELFYNPNTAQHLKQAQIAEIDSRIARLEQIVGYGSGDNVETLVRLLFFLKTHQMYQTSHLFRPLPAK